MAILRDNSLSLEVIFKEVDDCLWLKYEVYFRWDEQYVFRDALLKRSPQGWAGRSEGALCANESGGDTFLPVLEMAIDTAEPICWKPTEPDIMIAFYPVQHFPFIADHKKEIYVADHILNQRDERRQLKAAHNGQQPDDVVTMIVYVDAYNFKDCSPYYGTGFAMVLSPTRSGLARFHQELKREYEAFVIREQLAERIAERDAQWEEETDKN
jgi:hypothetical protein